MNNNYKEILTQDFDNLPPEALALTCVLVRNEAEEIQNWLETYQGWDRRFLIATWVDLLLQYDTMYLNNLTIH